MKFELLPNEIFVECFEYLHIIDLLYSFNQLNSRFYQLIRRIRLHLDFQDIRLTKFSRFCQQIPSDLDMKQQIYSLRLSNIPNPASMNGGDTKNRSNLTFTDVLKPETETGQRWRSYIDIVAEGLDDLQQSNDPSQFKNVWISLFDYFTNEKHLHNLLWVYAPDQGAPKPSIYYAGDDYVDIVAVDAYIDNPTSMKGYEEMIKLNKPFALGEVGPHTLNGQFDYSLWPTTIETLFNLTTYFYAWSGPWSPIENKNAYALFNNRHVINRDQM